VQKARQRTGADAPSSIDFLPAVSRTHEEFPAALFGRKLDSVKRTEPR
jgi:hypothetical protein